MDSYYVAPGGAPCQVSFWGIVTDWGPNFLLHVLKVRLCRYIIVVHVFVTWILIMWQGVRSYVRLRLRDGDWPRTTQLATCSLRVFLGIQYFVAYVCVMDPHNATGVEFPCQVMRNHPVYFLCNFHEDAFCFM